MIHTVDHTADLNLLENINKAVVINPIALISLILLNADQHALKQDELLARIEHIDVCSNNCATTHV